MDGISISSSDVKISDPVKIVLTVEQGQSDDKLNEYLRPGTVDALVNQDAFGSWLDDLKKTSLHQ